MDVKDRKKFSWWFSKIKDVCLCVYYMIISKQGEQVVDKFDNWTKPIQYILPNRNVLEMTKKAKTWNKWIVFGNNKRGRVCIYPDGLPDYIPDYILDYIIYKFIY